MSWYLTSSYFVHIPILLENTVCFRSRLTSNFAYRRGRGDNPIVLRQESRQVPPDELARSSCKAQEIFDACSFPHFSAILLILCRSCPATYRQLATRFHATAGFPLDPQHHASLSRCIRTAISHHIRLIIPCNIHVSAPDTQKLVQTRSELSEDPADVLGFVRLLNRKRAFTGLGNVVLRILPSTISWTVRRRVC
jgi:hypothetical protein